MHRLLGLLLALAPAVYADTGNALIDYDGFARSVAEVRQLREARRIPEAQFMRMAAAGVYNGMAFHRVAPGFVIQTGSLVRCETRPTGLGRKKRVLVVDDSITVREVERQLLLHKGYEVAVDSSFRQVLKGCASRAETWLGREMQAAYLALHEAGYAHSFETWRDGDLVGGLYGVAIGRMFFGESMFSRATDASKVALVALVSHLKERGFPLIDCQMKTPLLASLGGREIPRRAFLRQVAALVNYAEPRGKWSLVAT